MSAVRPPAGRHAIVTAAGRGLGRGAALAWAEARVHVSLVARPWGALDDVAAGVEALGAVLGCARPT